MKRKWLAIALAMSVMMSMAGCGSQNTETTVAETTTEETTAGVSITDLEDYNAADYVSKVEYLGVEVAIEDKVVTDDEFAEAIQMLLEEYATVEQITDRLTEEGDTIVYDYSGAIDGVVFDGGTATYQTLTLGEGNFIDGFEEGLIGAACGEEFVVDATFDEDYGVDELNGKTAQFTMYIHYIQGETILPELNDEFVKGLEDYTVSTVDEFKDVYYAELSEQKAAYMDSVAMNELWTTLLTTAELTGYPENYVEAYVQDMLNSYEYMASYYGLTLENFASMYGMTLEEFEATIQEIAEEQVKSEVLFHYIADQEGITVTEEEYLAVVEEYMAYYGYTDMTSFVNDYGVDVVEKQGYADALLEKVMEFCYENAVKVDAPVEETTAEETSEAVG